jgi:integrase
MVEENAGPSELLTASGACQLRVYPRAIGAHEAGLSPRTVVRHLTVAHGVFKHAMRKHGLHRNPASADLVDRPNVNYSGEFRALDAEQLAALIRHAASEQDTTLYLTAAHSGLRQGELRALRWRDVDFAADRIHVRHSARIGSGNGIKAPKSGRVRSVPMVPQLATALAKLSQREHFTDDDDFVFGNIVGEVEHDNLLRRRYYRALKDAKLPRVRFHDLRHVFGSTAVKASRSPTCRRSSATRTSPPPCGTSTTDPARTTRSAWPPRSEASPCPHLCPETGTQTATQSN